MRTIKDIAYGNCETQKLNIYLPEADAKDVFVYFHGGGIENGDKSTAENCAVYLTERGIAVVSANYRLYPTAVYPEFIRDAAAAVHWAYTHMKEYGSYENFYVGGSSAGAYLSMMLCFDKRYLAPYQIEPSQLSGYIHNSGQPTCHMNVLRERGIDKRRVIVDEAAPLYHVGRAQTYPPMLFIMAENDVESRYEQTMLMMSTMKHFGHGDKISLKVASGGHCSYVRALDENGDSVFGKLIYEWLTDIR